MPNALNQVKTIVVLMLENGSFDRMLGFLKSDTYPIAGYQHLVLFHRPSRLFVPLARLKNTAQVMTIHRVDLHARTSRDGRTVCIDATHEGLGRQMYIVPIRHILDHPPGS